MRPAHYDRMTLIGNRYLALLVSFSILFSGCIFNSDNADSSFESFPQFNSVADDGQNYSNEKFDGEPYVVIFSAEWCDAPCHSTMHTINTTLNGPPIIVMSTDPAENPQGISLEDWHKRADAHDDEDDDIGQTLDFPFVKGIDVAEEIKITSRPTVVFVNSNGEITSLHKGGLDDSEQIIDYWELAGGTL